MMLNQLINILNFPLRKLKSLVKNLLGWVGKPCIILYRGFANQHQFYIRGRVIEDTGLAKPEERHRFWDNIIAMIKRYGSSGLSNRLVEVIFNGQTFTLRSDDDGYFTIDTEVPGKSNNSGLWRSIQARMINEDSFSAQNTNAESEILRLDRGHAYGVITDIDDTILISHATNVRKKLKLMLFKNAKTRLPFDGAAAFYQALYQGPKLEQNHPFFYVSSSEWNLYDLLVDFCHYHNFPKGTFLLRDAKINLKKIWKAGSGNHNHKYDKICRILAMSDPLPFILVGDSGQHDAEIYAQIARNNHGRVAVIYIRDVRPSRHQTVKQIAADLAKENITMVLVPDTEEAALHALQNGFIHPEAVQDIIDEKKLNQAMESEFSQILEKIVE
jgi:phosphatidate phosphatase APP1